MKRAAGILFIAPSRKVLLMRRAARPEQDADCQGCWSIPGGGLEDGEDAERAARREISEEVGIDDIGEITYLTRRAKDDVDFTTFLAKAPDEFEPKLNDEHDLYQWTEVSFALTSTRLHPGLYVTLQRFGMDELAVAKAIRDGDLTSPQRYNENLMLVALRITGTGLSYRGAHDEYVFRDPSIYMNQEFLERCSGLPVILDHPKKTMLTTDEFRGRIVGTIFVPYLKDPDEVWGIAKILDMDAAHLFENHVMSTSPAVMVLGDQIDVPDGRKLLFEGKPFLLDHLAALIPDPDSENPNSGAGVWDKGQGLKGVESIDATPIGPAEEPLDIVYNAVRGKQIDEALSRAVRL